MDQANLFMSSILTLSIILLVAAYITLAFKISIEKFRDKRRMIKVSSLLDDGGEILTSNSRGIPVLMKCKNTIHRL